MLKAFTGPLPFSLVDTEVINASSLALIMLSHCAEYEVVWQCDQHNILVFSLLTKQKVCFVFGLRHKSVFHFPFNMPCSGYSHEIQFPFVDKVYCVYLNSFVNNYVYLLVITGIAGKR